MRTKAMSPLRAVSAVLLTTAVVLVIAGPMSAGPFDPAYRGDPNSVHAIFDWVTFASVWNTTLFDVGPSIHPLDPTVPFASDDGKDMRIGLPNFIDELPLKLMRIQLMFDGAVSGDSIAYDVFPFDPLPTAWNVAGGSGPGVSNAHWVDIEIVPNPDSEQIIVYGSGNAIPGNLLRIEVDTVSMVPEPATLTMLVPLLGGLAFLRRGRSTRS